MNEVSIERLQELESDLEFRAKIKAAKSTHDVIEIMKEYGIQISEDEFKTGYAQAVERFVEEGYMENGELTERGLEMVTGGVFVPTYLLGIGAALGGIAMGPAGIALWLGGLAVATCSIPF